MRSAAALFLALTLARAGLAQQPVMAPTRSDTIFRALAGLPNVPVRLRTGDVVQQFERLELRSGGFVLKGTHAQRRLEPAEVESLWLQQSNPARAAFIGMAWGAGIGFAGGAIGTILQGPCEYCININPVIGGVIFGIPALVLGTISGATIEAAFPRWRRIY